MRRTSSRKAVAAKQSALTQKLAHLNKNSVRKVYSGHAIGKSDSEMQKYRKTTKEIWQYKKDHGE